MNICIYIYIYIYTYFRLRCEAPPPSRCQPPPGVWWAGAPPEGNCIKYYACAVDCANNYPSDFHVSLNKQF